MKAIYYEVLKGDKYKMVIQTKDVDEIDSFLDQLNIEVKRYISEDEFNNEYKEVMTLDIMNADSSIKIGELTMKKMDLKAGVEIETI